jgi:uncharacterized protein (UPF0335 family)
MGKSGHNSFAKDALKSYFERIERLQEEKDALSADMKEVYAEAKGTGFDTKIMRKVIALRKMDKAELQEMDDLLDLYRTAVGLGNDDLV